MANPNLLAQVQARNSKPARNKSKIFLSSLPSSTTKHDLLEVFSQFGKVREVKLFIDKKLNFCRGFGSIEFTGDVNVEQISSMQHRVLGRSVMCELFIEKQEDLENRESLNSKKRLFVSNIPRWMDNKSLQAIFNRFGRVKSAYRIQKFNTGSKMPFGYVYFEEITSAERCLQEEIIYVGEKDGFMFVERYTKDKKNKTMMKRQRKEKIKEFKRRAKVGTVVMRDDSYQMPVVSNHDNSGNEEGKIIQGRANHGSDRQAQGLSTGQIVDASERPQHPQTYTPNQSRPNGTQGYLRGFLPQKISQEELEAKKIRARKINRQIKFNMMKPVLKKYWKFSIKRANYFREKDKKDNFRFNKT